MKIVGLIAEYNPFHNGHLYHIKKALEITGADAALVVMSGNYVQRGTPAIMPKHLRAKVALESGVAAVIELPVCYATGSAEYFASGAVSLLDNLGCVDALCFGSECGDYTLLERIAKILIEEPEDYTFYLKEALRKGLSFPRARQQALSFYLKDESIDQVLNEPNNILGIEYIKALYTRNSSIKGYTIKRKLSGYHDDELNDSLSSASAIRKLLAQAGSSIHLRSDSIYDEPPLSDVLTRLEDQVPHSCIQLLRDTHLIRYPIYANDFSLLLKYRLLTEDFHSLMKYLDLTEDLTNRIRNHADDFITFEQFCDLIKSRDLTYTRISRSLLHILLEVKTSDLVEYEANGGCQYAHILGFRKDQSTLLTKLKRTAKIPLLTKLTQTDELTDVGVRMLETDIQAANLYESVITDKFKIPFYNEYRHQIVRIEEDDLF
ncbi:MAG: nucleotidyltransferase [Lachnospiraceae bacterium]|nr:nucleotidyltransferase [Lachnospiraceae bacterium]